LLAYGVLHLLRSHSSGITATGRRDLAVPSRKQRLLSYATNYGLVQQLSVDRSANPVVEQAGCRMAVGVAACWRPTATNYFGRVWKEI